jgi:hypothetical protein
MSLRRKFNLASALVVIVLLTTSLLARSPSADLLLRNRIQTAKTN